MFDCYWFRGNQPQPGVRASVPPHPSLPASLPLTPPQSRAQPSLHRGKQKAGREEATTVGAEETAESVKYRSRRRGGRHDGNTPAKTWENPHVKVRSREYPAPSLPTPFSPEPIKGPGGLQSISIAKSWTQLKRLSTHTCTQG